MSIRELYEYALIEMNKVEAPSLLLEDYNYFINKAVQQYINKVYNRYDINQQSSDDLRVLKATAEIQLKRVPWNRLNENEQYMRDAATGEIQYDEDGKPIPVTNSGTGYHNHRRAGNKNKFIYEGILPADYVHILNCIVDFRVKQNYKCYQKGDYVEFAARRLTADLASGILQNVYMKPDYKRPYFYIHNLNSSTKSDLNSPGNIKSALVEGTDVTKKYDYNTTSPELDGGIITSTDRESVNPEGNRVANTSDVRIEIRFGDDDSVFEPEYIYVDYIKAPMFIRLTYDDIVSTEDNTRVLEFPDYVCYEIVNEFVKLLMENASDPRLQTNYAINQTIGDPTVSNQSQSKDKS